MEMLGGGRCPGADVSRLKNKKTKHRWGRKYLVMYKPKTQPVGKPDEACGKALSSDDQPPSLKTSICHIYCHFRQNLSTLSLHGRFHLVFIVNVGWNRNRGVRHVFKRIKTNPPEPLLLSFTNIKNNIYNKYLGRRKHSDILFF